MATPGQEYLKMKVMSATPEMLTLMLWDGAIRFAEQGKEYIIQKDREGSYRTLMRAQKIIMELLTSLRHEHDPDLCGKLAALYNFIHRRLVQANMKKEIPAINDALQIMRHQRETWAMVCEKVAQERQAAAAAAKEGADVEASLEGTDVPSVAEMAAPEEPIVAAAPARKVGYPAFAGRAGVSVGMSSLSLQG